MGSKRLVIAEKPSVARDIAAALGGFTDHDDYLESEDWVVTFALGHLLELAEPEDYDKVFRSWSIKLLPIIPETFQVRPREGQKKRIDIIKRLAARDDVSGVVNACDAGREGELIFRRIIEYTGVAKPAERLWLQSMTANAIRQAFSALLPGNRLDRLGDAAWLRAVGDWLVGMNATRALTQRLKSRGESGSWSAGRVQTPTLALLVRREREIHAHVSRPYWEITARFKVPAAGGTLPTGGVAHEWEARFWDPGTSSKASTASEDEAEQRPSRIFDRARVDRLLACLAGAREVHAGERRRKSRQSPPLLFDLTTLQREANRRFSLSAKRTLDAAQRLYEQHKLLTYPRTDARYLPSDYEPTVRTVLEQLSRGGASLPSMPDVAGLAAHVASNPLNLDKLLDSTKVSDHFAISPTGNPLGAPLSGDDARVFELVVRQYLAAMMGPATWSQVERIVEIPIGERDPMRFRATARTLEIPGFLVALGQSADDSNPLPALNPGSDEAFRVPTTLCQWVDEAKETRAPPRFNEAQLLRMMETAGEQVAEEDLSDAMRGRGLGTPATRAEVIEKLVGSAYMRRVEGKLAPTSKAMRLMDVLERADAAALTSPKLTGEWQFSLDQVEHGQKRRDEVQDDLVSYTRSVVQALVGFEHERLYAGDPPLGVCPECGAAVGESAWGYPCKNNTGADGKCSFIIWKDRAGRYMDRELVRKVLAERTVGPVDGFVDRSGRRFLTGTVKLEKDPEKQRWVLATEFGASIGTVEEVRGDPIFRCPCGVDDCAIVETSQRYVCRRVLDGLTRAGPVLPKSVCSREMSVEEAGAFFGESGKTALLENFISKRNRPFKGFLVRRPTGRHGFEFLEREPRADGTPARRGRAQPAEEQAGTSKVKSKAKKGVAKEAVATPEPKPSKGAGSKKGSAKKASPKAKKATRKVAPKASADEG